MKRAQLLIALGILVSAGCGGSNGGGVGGLTTIEGQIRKGWTKTYQVTGFFTPNGGSQQVASGTLVIKCTDRVGTVVTETRTLDFTTNGVEHTYTDTLVSSQAVDGTLTEVSLTVGNNPTLTVQSTNFDIPGTWSASTNVSGTTTYTDSSVQTNTLVVSGSTQVSVPVGTMDAWSTAYTDTYQGNTLENFSEFYVPSMAGYIYASGSRVLPDGEFDGAFALQETNVPIP